MKPRLQIVTLLICLTSATFVAKYSFAPKGGPVSTTPSPEPTAERRRTRHGGEPNSSPTLGRLSKRDKRGLSINGLQPGDRLSEIIAELPPGVFALERPYGAEPHGGTRLVGLIDEWGDEFLTLVSDSETDIVMSLCANWHVTDGLTVERSGAVVTHNLKPLAKVKAELKLDQPGQEKFLAEDGVRLELQEIGPNEWSRIVLRSESSAAEQDLDPSAPEPPAGVAHP